MGRPSRRAEKRQQLQEKFLFWGVSIKLRGGSNSNEICSRGVVSCQIQDISYTCKLLLCYKECEAHTHLWEPSSEVVWHLGVEQGVEAGVGVRQHVGRDLTRVHILINHSTWLHLKDYQVGMGVPRWSGGDCFVEQNCLYWRPTHCGLSSSYNAQQCHWLFRWCQMMRMIMEREEQGVTGWTSLPPELKVFLTTFNDTIEHVTNTLKEVKRFGERSIYIYVQVFSKLTTSSLPCKKPPNIMVT